MRVLGVGLSHDASAVMVVDDELVAAVEEERLNRMKHWNYVPVNAMRYCLEAAGLTLADVDAVAVAGNQRLLDARLADRLARSPGETQYPDFTAYLGALLERELGADVRGKLTYYDHHLSHAFGAYATAGLPNSLVVTLDGAGDGISGMSLSAVDAEVEELGQIHPNNSLGLLYEEVTRHLGYRLFDEYKVMGLAPYGDPSVHRDVFTAAITLADDGAYTVDLPAIVAALRTRVPPRPAGSEFGKPYQDLAAALQEAVERVGLHYLTKLGARTGHRHLCYSGGFAHNCSLNGKLLATRAFDKIHVAAAADDSGIALGAACLAALEQGDWSLRARDEVYLGPLADAGVPDVLAAVARWPAVTATRVADVETHTAKLLADGLVVAWVQGRAEFGPRALGNRSILADPRPAENKGRINAMIKKREAYRPFAPSVIAEAVGDYFETSGETDLPTMSVVLPVRADQRERLGAITHVDGSARVQTVRREANPRYHALISAFGAITGVPIVLNTSFNNHREPIVTSVHDAVTTFLTTGLDRLVIGDVVVSKRDAAARAWMADVHVALEPVVTLHDDGVSARAEASHFALKTLQLSRELYRVLHGADGTTTVAARAAAAKVDLTDALYAELADVWSERHIVLSPDPIDRRKLYWPTPFDVQWF